MSGRYPLSAERFNQHFNIVTTGTSRIIGLHSLVATRGRVQGVSVYVLSMSVQVAPVISTEESKSGPSHVNRKQYACDDVDVWHST